MRFYFQIRHKTDQLFCQSDKNPCLLGGQLSQLAAFHPWPITAHQTSTLAYFHIQSNRSSHLGIHKQTNACWSIPRSQTMFIHFKICIRYAESGNYKAFVVIHFSLLSIITFIKIKSYGNCECLTCKMGLVLILLSL